MSHDVLNDAQLRTRRWVLSCLGDAKFNSKTERGLRLVEEAIEVAQALGITQVALFQLISRVYSRPVGEIRQELAGTAVCLLAAASSCEVLLGDALEEELQRLEKTDPEVFRAKNRQKEADGVSVPVEMPKGVIASK